ncbi:uncharacterized protein GIQ15_00708 [Arthroderma uncinatum]|uniref:uncharacterized protein n=1 Tax=Arthroderma uncinatum TaxID=74035 RepID=UPI00144A7A67|nr:uncharacterized protein GIQ15_00708 [Arthroderma uncinatum]KAF3491191.1 hypothetical protein GIQ15_00708 [Arthroderma uncinatum]
MSANLTDFSLHYTPMLIDANASSRRNSRTFERHSASASSTPSSSRACSPAPASRQRMDNKAAEKKSSTEARASFFANLG